MPGVPRPASGYSPIMAVLTANRPGGVIALVGGVLTGLAYLVLPVATVPLIGSITAPSLAGQAPDTPSLGLLPLVPVASVVTIAVGLWLALAAPKGRARVVGAGGVLVCAVLTVLAYLLPYVQVNNAINESGAASLGISATTFTGSGFWLALIGALLAAIGAGLELNAAARRA